MIHNIFIKIIYTYNQEGGISIDIKIIGSKCKNGIKLIKNIKKLNCDINFNILELNDEDSYKKYNIKNIPSIVIDENVVSSGKVLTERELCRLLTSY